MVRTGDWLREGGAGIRASRDAQAIDTVRAWQQHGFLLFQENRKASPESKAFAMRWGGEIFLCPLLSEYQVGGINAPKFFEVIVVEVMWNEGQNFGT